ncbi:MAG: ABC transporter ATP-binding protein [Burkholderiaceae bacterium]
MADLLTAKGLNKRFGALHVSRDLDLVLTTGARHALIGPNGAGKTTFVNLLAGNLAPDSGEIYLLGDDVSDEDTASRARRGLGRTFQINQLFGELSVLENVCLGLAEHAGIAERFWQPLGQHDAVIDRSYALLEQFGLQSYAASKLGELPYGVQRLTELVITLGQEPAVLLLDEPAAGVASAESDIILDVIDSLDPDTAVLIIDHDMDIIFRFASRITVMVNGAILMEGSPDEVAGDSRVRDAYLGQGT